MRMLSQFYENIAFHFTVILLSNNPNFSVIYTSKDIDKDIWSRINKIKAPRFDVLQSTMLSITFWILRKFLVQVWYPTSKTGIFFVRIMINFMYK